MSGSWDIGGQTIMSMTQQYIMTHDKIVTTWLELTKYTEATMTNRTNPGLNHALGRLKIDTTQYELIVRQFGGLNLIVI